ncbi:peroxide stress protein YaaA [Pseudonocardia phyllosphaerae]|uniref:peroxide stress protein YaaA n=1 Tax=Pseudonocardia phyllosphaerae TaxID=3390502 RepID=UPI00397DC567
MLVLLPPSETKRAGGDGPPLDLAALSHDADLGAVRKELADELVALAADRPAARAALGVSARQDAEIDRNAALFTSPTMPALDRYTGVLYDALDAGSFTRAVRDRARSRLAVQSALFGVVGADDPIPAYRLSAGSKLPGSGTLASRWRPVADPLLARIAAGELVVDLRSGGYAALGAVPGAVTVNVLAERPDGSRSVVSHHNKSHKGGLARLLAASRAEPADATAVARIARRAGHTVERDGDHLDLVIPA